MAAVGIAAAARHEERSGEGGGCGVDVYSSGCGKLTTMRAGPGLPPAAALDPEGATSVASDADAASSHDEESSEEDAWARGRRGESVGRRSTAGAPCSAQKPAARASINRAVASLTLAGAAGNRKSQTQNSALRKKRGRSAGRRQLWHRHLSTRWHRSATRACRRGVELRQASRCAHPPSPPRSSASTPSSSSPPTRTASSSSSLRRPTLALW